MSDPQPLVDPDDPGRGPWIIAVTWVFTGIAVIAVTAQFYVRKKSKTPFGWADWLLLASLIVRVAHQIQISVSLQYGFGKHDYSLTPYERVMINKSNWVSIPINTFVSTVPRVAITILLIRLFGVHTWVKWFFICLTCLQVVLGIVFIAITYSMITPVEGLWNVFLADAKRWDPRIWLYFAYFLQSLYTFSDLTYVLIPVLIVWRLNMNLHRRIGLILLLSASLVTMALSILKTVSIAAVANSTQNTPDVQYDASLQVLYGLLEQTFVIIIACVPGLRNVRILKANFTGLGSSLFSLIRRSKTRTGSGSSGDQYASSGAYAELELSTHKLGSLPGTAYVPEASCRQGTSHEQLVNGDNKVRRVDEYTVSFS